MVISLRIVRKVIGQLELRLLAKRSDVVLVLEQVVLRVEVHQLIVGDVDVSILPAIVFQFEGVH